MLTLIGCLVLAGLSVFQVALIAGAPLGRFAWGGGNKVLPQQFRIASAFSVLLYVFFAVLLLSKGGVAGIVPAGPFLDIAMWVVTAYFFLGVLMNAISRSKSERMLMTPVALVLAVVFLSVAAS